MNKDSDKYNALTATWSFLSLTLRYPDPDLARSLGEGPWSEAALEVAGLMMPILGSDTQDAQRLAAASSAWAAKGAPSRLEDLRVEATRLFVAPDPPIPPYEGVWRSAVDGTESLIAVNPHSLDVARFCKRCGLKPQMPASEPPDHVCVECELLSYLAYRSCEEALGSAADQRMPGSSAQGAYRAFMEEHALRWMPEFADALAAEARLPLYTFAAALLRAVTAVEP